jgi:rRNA maturation protein Nop10
MTENTQILESKIYTLTSVLTCPHCGQASEEIIPPDM